MDLEYMDSPMKPWTHERGRRAAMSDFEQRQRRQRERKASADEAIIVDEALPPMTAKDRAAIDARLFVARRRLGY